MLDNWQEVFGDKFERKSTHKARRLFSQVFDARNADAHLDLPLTRRGSAELPACDVELATLLKAPQPIQAKLKAAYDAQRGSGVAAPAPTPTPQRRAAPPRRSSTCPASRERGAVRRQGAEALDRGRPAASGRDREPHPAEPNSPPTCSPSTPATPRATTPRRPSFSRSPTSPKACGAC